MCPDLRSRFWGILKIRAIHTDPEAMTEYEKYAVTVKSAMPLLLVKWVNLKKLVNLKYLRPIGTSEYVSHAYKAQKTCSKQFTTTVVIREKLPNTPSQVIWNFF